MSKNSLSFCNVDEPALPGLLPPTDISFGSTAYIRYHGRNSQNWWHHEHAYQRYDYSYTKEELLPWVARIKNIGSRAEQIFVYFNNHYRAKAVKSAKILSDLLKDNHIITSQN